MDELQSYPVIGQSMDAVRADLYDGLFIYSMLQHETTQQYSPSVNRLLDTSQDVRSKWHRFLDGLCFLCDSRCGGKSVVVILPEQIVGETVLWIKTYPTYQKDAVQHLDTVLGLLKESLHGDADGVHPLAEEIVRRSIERSAQRVNNYACRLRNLVLRLATQSRMEVLNTGMLLRVPETER